MLSRMYQDESSSILMNGKPRNAIQIRKGVRQGGSSSPVCFNFIPNELAIVIRGSKHCAELQDDIKIGALMYADDIVLTGPDWRAIRGLTELTEKLLKTYSLEINADNSQVIVFGAKSKLRIYIQGKDLRHTPEYKYLGAIKDLKAAGRKNQTERQCKMEFEWRSYMGVISGYRGVEIKKKLAMARACINSTGSYCLEASGPIDGRALELLERIQRRFARFK